MEERGRGGFVFFGGDVVMYVVCRHGEVAICR